MSMTEEERREALVRSISSATDQFLRLHTALARVGLIERELSTVAAILTAATLIAGSIQEGAN